MINTVVLLVTANAPFTAGSGKKTFFLRGMPVKDYYKILEIPPDATPQDIKKAWRRLAQLYHPDKDSSGRFATSYFHELQEAYEILSDNRRRARYDEERWLDGYARKKQPRAVTPHWILSECLKLGSHMAKVDTYRMNHAALHDYVFLLLSDAHMAILQQAGDTATNHQIVRELLKAVKPIHYPYFKNIAARLALLAEDDESLVHQIYHAEEQSRRHAQWARYKPYIIVGIALLLCMLMYIYVHLALR